VFLASVISSGRRHLYQPTGRLSVFHGNVYCAGINCRKNSPDGTSFSDSFYRRVPQVERDTHVGTIWFVCLWLPWFDRDTSKSTGKNAVQFSRRFLLFRFLCRLPRFVRVFHFASFSSISFCFGAHNSTMLRLREFVWNCVVLVCLSRDVQCLMYIFICAIVLPLAGQSSQLCVDRIISQSHKPLGIGKTEYFRSCKYQFED